MSNRRKFHYVNDIRDQVTHTNSSTSWKGSKDRDLVMHRSLKTQSSIRVARCHFATVKHVAGDQDAEHEQGLTWGSAFTYSCAHKSHFSPACSSSHPPSEQPNPASIPCTLLYDTSFAVSQVWTLFLLPSHLTGAIPLALQFLSCTPSPMPMDGSFLSMSNQLGMSIRVPVTPCRHLKPLLEMSSVTEISWVQRPVYP